MPAVSINPYTVSIEPPSILPEQRAQVTHGERIYDISWDTVNERVVVDYAEQNQSMWVEIRCDDTEPVNITLGDVLIAFGCVSADTVPVLIFPLNTEYVIENYLVTPISTEFLMQMSVLDGANDDDTLSSTGLGISVGDDDTLSSTGLGISVGDDDPSPTSSDNESIEEDSDDPQI